MAHDTPFQPPSQLPEQKNHRKLTECFLRNKTKLLMLCLFTFPHKPLPGFKCIYGGRSQPHSVYPDIPNSSWATRQTQTPTEGRKVPSSPWKSKIYFCHLFFRDRKRETVGGEAIPSSWSSLSNGEVRRGWRHRAGSHSWGVVPKASWVCSSGSQGAEHLLSNVPGNGREQDTEVSQWCGDALSLNTSLSHCLGRTINTSGLTAAVATL